MSESLHWETRGKKYEIETHICGQTDLRRVGMFIFCKKCHRATAAKVHFN